jgi:hypothetical protein
MNPRDILTNLARPRGGRELTNRLLKAQITPFGVKIIQTFA